MRTKHTFFTAALSLLFAIILCVAGHADPPPLPLPFTISADAPDRLRLQAMVARFPTRFWTGDAGHAACLDFFDVREPATTQAWLDAGRAADGRDIGGDMGKTYYDRHLILIRLNRFCPPDAILAHELAHVVWADYLSDADRAQWQGIYDDDLKAGRSCSKYARTDAQEGFCEAVRCWLGAGLPRGMERQQAFLVRLWRAGQA